MHSKATFIPVRKNDLPHNELGLAASLQRFYKDQFWLQSSW